MNNADEWGTTSVLWKAVTSLHKAGALEAGAGATEVVGSKDHDYLILLAHLY